VTFRGLGVAATIVLITCASAATLRAEGRKALLLDLDYSVPLEWTVGAAFYRSNQFWDEGGRGLFGGGRLGKHGMQAWSGWAGLGGPTNVDVRAVVTRTWESPPGRLPTLRTWAERLVGRTCADSAQGMPNASMDRRRAMATS